MFCRKISSRVETRLEFLLFKLIVHPLEQLFLRHDEPPPDVERGKALAVHQRVRGVLGDAEDLRHENRHSESPCDHRGQHGLFSSMDFSEQNRLNSPSAIVWIWIWRFYVIREIEFFVWNTKSGRFGSVHDLPVFVRLCLNPTVERT